MLEQDIKLFWPAIPSKEDVLPKIEELLWPKDKSRPFVGEGALVDQFEQECQKKWGFDYVLFTNSGTSGLDLALLGAGIKAGDEVISTPMTCTATNTPLLMRQAKIVFADVQYDTANMDPKDLEKKITDKTKAVMLVHWAGYPCDLDEINKIASKKGIPVIADGAHALGAKYHNQPISKFADYTMFSLQSIKQMTTIDGGLLAISFKNSRKDLVEFSKDLKNREILRNLFGKILNNYFASNNSKSLPKNYFADEVFKKIKAKEVTFRQGVYQSITKDYNQFESFWLDWQKAESIRRSRWFGIGRDERVPSPEKGYSAYPTFEYGGKFHANNMAAIIGLASLKKIDSWQKRRKQIVQKYNSELKNVPGVVLFKQEKDRESGNWLYNIHVERRDDFVRTMAYKGIETSIVHERNDLLPIFGGKKQNFPNLEKLNKVRICIPLHQELTDKQVDYVISSIKSGW